MKTLVSLPKKKTSETAGGLIDDAKLGPVEDDTDFGDGLVEDGADEIVDETLDVVEPEVDETEQMVGDFLTQTKNVNAPNEDANSVTVDRRMYDDMTVELNYLRNKTEFFRSMLRGVLYRSDDEIEMEVGRAQQRVYNMQYPALIKDYLKRTYPEHFWHNEPDIRFKAALAKGLQDTVKSRDPRCNYPPITTIVNGKSDSVLDATYDYLMNSYIER